MLKYSDYFNGKEAFDYPFAKNIECFSVLGSTMGSIFDEKDFGIIMDFLKGNKGKILDFYKKDVNKDKFIFTERLNIKDLDYKEYDKKYYLTDEVQIVCDNGIVFSGHWEGFIFIGSTQDIIDKLMYAFGKKQYTERAINFIEEWEYYRDEFGVEDFISPIKNRYNFIFDYLGFLKYFYSKSIDMQSSSEENTYLYSYGLEHKDLIEMLNYCFDNKILIKCIEVWDKPKLNFNPVDFWYDGKSIDDNKKLIENYLKKLGSFMDLSSSLYTVDFNDNIINTELPKVIKPSKKWEY